MKTLIAILVILSPCFAFAGDYETFYISDGIMMSNGRIVAFIMSDAINSKHCSALEDAVIMLPKGTTFGNKSSTFGGVPFITIDGPICDATCKP